MSDGTSLAARGLIVRDLEEKHERALEQLSRAKEAQEYAATQLMDARIELERAERAAFGEGRSA